MIEAHTDIGVDVEDNLGGTQVCYEASKPGKLTCTWTTREPFTSAF